MKYLFNNCTLLNKKKVNILVEDNLIKVVSEGEIRVDADKIFNLDKKLVLPGLIDIKASAKYVDTNDWIVTKESKAYLKGGVTSIIEFPHEQSDLVSFNEALWKNIELYNNMSSINFSFANSTDLSFEHGTYEPLDFLMMTRLFLDGMHVNDGIKESISEFMKKIYEVCDKSNSLLISMKDKNINTFFKYFKDKNINVGFFDISNAKEVKRINAFKEQGYKFYSILNIDNLFISQELLSTPIKKTKFQGLCSIPTSEEIKELTKCLLNNEIDIIVPCHIPLKILEKMEFHRKGNPNAETFLPLIFDLVLYHGIDLEVLNNMLYLNIKKFLNIKNRLEIKEGNIADLVVVDLDKFWFVGEGDIISSAGWTQYEGKRFWGVPILTMVNGKIGYDCNDEKIFPNDYIKCHLIKSE